MAALHQNPFILLGGDLSGNLPNPMLRDSVNARLAAQIFGTRIPSVAATASSSPSSPTTTEGDLIVRGASVDERLAIGNDGEVLTVLGNAAVWTDPSAGTGSGSFINPRRRYDLFHDFEKVANASLAPYGTNTSSTGTVTDGTDDDDHLGVITFSRGTTAGSGALIGGSATLTTVARDFVLQATPIYFESLIRVPTLPDGTQTFTPRFGLNDSTANANVCLAVIVWNGSVAEWQLSTTKASSNTVTASGVTALTNTWQRVRIEASLSEVNLYIDDMTTPIVNYTGANIPVLGMVPWAGLVGSAGGSNRTVDMDWWWVYKNWASDRF